MNEKNMKQAWRRSVPLAKMRLKVPGQRDKSTPGRSLGPSHARACSLTYDVTALGAHGLGFKPGWAPSQSAKLYIRMKICVIPSVTTLALH